MLSSDFDISLGVGASILVFLYRSSRPHAAIIGQVPGTEHYRNVKRHKVDTLPGVLSIRVDESLYFANARFLEDLIYGNVAANPAVAHVVLLCSAVNAVDMSALESLEAFNGRLKDLGVGFHLSEVKGPVMDRLADTEFLKHLTGQAFLSHHAAMDRLANVIVRALDNGAVEISAINPVASMQAISNADLHAVAGEVADRLRSVIDAI